MIMISADEIHRIQGLRCTGHGISGEPGGPKLMVEMFVLDIGLKSPVEYSPQFVVVRPS